MSWLWLAAAFVAGFGACAVAVMAACLVAAHKPCEGCPSK